MFTFRSNFIAGMTFRVMFWYVGEVVDSANRISMDKESKSFQPYAGGPVFHEYV